MRRLSPSITHFALGLSAAARVAETDSTRPENMNRDRARGLYLHAVAVDPHLARVWLDLARLELDNDRPREASEDAQQARSAAADWWPAELQLADALRARGLERDADAALAAAVARGRQGQGACAVLEGGLRRAEERDAVGEQERLVRLLARCDAQSEVPVQWYRQRGDVSAAEAALRRMLPTSAEPAWVRSELAALRLERGDAASAASELQALVDWSPRDSHLRLRLVDALLAAGAAKAGARPVGGDAAAFSRKRRGSAGGTHLRAGLAAGRIPAGWRAGDSGLSRVWPSLPSARGGGVGSHGRAGVS